MKNLRKSLTVLFAAAILTVTISANAPDCPPWLEIEGHICTLIIDDTHVCAYQCI